MKKTLLGVLLSFVLIFSGMFLAKNVRAQDSEVNLTVQVLERKSSDTINDFDFSSLNTFIQPKSIAGEEITAPTLNQPESPFFIRVLKEIHSFLRRIF